MRYKLKTLSPIHIGNGEQISNWSYSAEKEKISIYNFEKVIRELKNNPQRLLNLTSEIEKNPLNKSLGNILKSYNIKTKPEYTVQLKGNIKRQRWDRNKQQNIIEYKQIWEFIKENGKVYIPGSEIKGAIRTALFYKILKDKFDNDQKLKYKFLEEYKDCLSGKNKGEIKSNYMKFSTRWENIVFRSGFKKIFDKEFKFTDAKRDFLRFLLISDSDHKKPDQILEIVDIISVGISRSFEDLHETVKKGLDFNIDIKITWKSKYKNTLSENYHYLGFKHIRQACNTFAELVLNTEIEYFKKISFGQKKDLLKKLNQRLSFIKFADEKKYLILRLGKHQGFHSTTINLLVKNLDYELYSKAFAKIAPKGYENNPNKSRKLTIDNELLGWCVLIPAE